MDRYTINAATVGHVPTGTTIKTLVTDAVLDYADTGEHLFTMSKNDVIEYFANYHLQIKIEYPNDPGSSKGLTIRAFSSAEEITTPLDEIKDTWDSKAITLTNGAATDDTEYYYLEDLTIRGNYLYLSYQYDAEPDEDPKVEIKLCRV